MYKEKGAQNTKAANQKYHNADNKQRVFYRAFKLTLPNYWERELGVTWVYGSGNLFCCTVQKIYEIVPHLFYLISR